MTQDNDDFIKQLEELLENPQSIKDDPYFDSDRNLFGTYSTTSALEDISEITLALPASNPQVYTDGPVNVSIQVKRGRPVSQKRFTCFIYSDDYFPMCNSQESGRCIRKGANHFDFEMRSQFIWVPGNYILFVSDANSEALTRIPFQLDDSLTAHLGEPTTCTPASPDSILTSCIENTESNWDILATAPGAYEMRKYALESRQLKIYNEVRKEMKGKELCPSQNLLIYTHNNDWDEDVLEAFQKLSAWGNYLTYLDCSDLYNAALQNPYEVLNEKFAATTSQVYCLTNIGAILSTGGKVVVKRIVEKMLDKSGKYKLWLVGTHHEIDDLLDVHPSLRKLFLRGHQVEQRPYTAFELVQAFLQGIRNANLDPSDEVKNMMARTILQQHREGCLSSWSLDNVRRFMAEEVLPRYLNRALSEMALRADNLPLLSVEDIDLSQLPRSKSAFEDSIEELRQMIGLDDIKQSIITMANQARFLIERRRAGLRTTSNAAYHAVFTGNPGTGKTTVAKMLGKIYHSIGLLSKGDVICADRTRLIGRYIGETEENMKVVLEEARGNVLFIDEAYNLYEGTVDRKDYGSKVIDSLLTVLSQPNPDMVVIFAGYEKEMEAMLTSNPGLTGRFPYKYSFIDYSADQLMQIASRLLSCDEYILTAEAEARLRECISDTVARRTKNFSNARWIEQFVRNGIIPAMSNRIVTSGSNDYQHILADDVNEGYQKFCPNKVELRPRKCVGFSA